MTSTPDDDAAQLAIEVARAAAADGEPDDLPNVVPIVGRPDATPESQKTVTRIEIPYRTIIRVVLTIFAVWILLQVWHIFLLVFIAIFLAMALLPIVLKLTQWGMHYVVAVATVIVILLAAFAGILALVVPPLVTQVQNLIDNAGTYADHFQDVLRRYPSIDRRVQEFRDNPPTFSPSMLPWRRVLSLSTGIVGGIANCLFVLILTIYLLLEGERSWHFIARYFTPRLRYRLRRAFPEILQVVSGYVRGQVITSVLFGIFAFIVLTIAGVPQPLLLALLAAILDAVPIVGVPVATVPALVLAATVSVPTVVVVLVAYTVYQQFENYFLVPRVFGNALQVSSISILLGILVGGQLLGIVGTLLALPITAAIPVLERVWNEEVPHELEEEETPRSA